MKLFRKNNTIDLNSVDFNSEIDREKLRKSFSQVTGKSYAWFKENRALEHWVLFDTEMYEVIPFCYEKVLHYKGTDGKPSFPINCSSCICMFESCALVELDLTDFNFDQIVDASYMFFNCHNLKRILVSKKINCITNGYCMFEGCESLKGFNQDNVDANMEKLTEQGGYLTLKK